jgi:hypothetical protein
MISLTYLLHNKLFQDYKRSNLLELSGAFSILIKFLHLPISNLSNLLLFYEREACNFYQLSMIQFANKLPPYHFLVDRTEARYYAGQFKKLVALQRLFCAK